MFTPPTTDWSTVTDDELCTQLECCARWRAALDAHEAAVIAEFEQREVARRAGYADSATWIAAHTHTASFASRARVEAAAVLSQLPGFEAALLAGTITSDHVRSVVRAAQDVGIGPVIANAERFLAQASRLDPERFARWVRRWVLSRKDDPNATSDQSGSTDDKPDAGAGTSPDDESAHVEPSGSAAEAATHAARRASIGTDPVSGFGFLHADLPAAEHAMVQDTLWAIADELWRAEHGDHLPPPDRLATTARQRLADALVEMARRAAGAGFAARNSARPLINVLINYDDLIGRLASHGIATLVNGSPIDASTARRLACEADIIPTVLGGNSEPLDVGRAHRLATTAQRRAMLARSTTCEWAGCTTPASWCQAHHLDYWDNGGFTDIANLAWLCNRHHHDAHEGGWTLIRNTIGDLVATAPDRRTSPPHPDAHPDDRNRPPDIRPSPWSIESPPMPHTPVALRTPVAPHTPVAPVAPVATRAPAATQVQQPAPPPRSVPAVDVPAPSLHRPEERVEAA